MLEPRWCSATAVPQRRILGCRYCATLGYAAGALVAEGKTGLMATASCLDRPCADWAVGGYPLVDMMCIERRRGK